MVALQIESCKIATLKNTNANTVSHKKKSELINAGRDKRKLWKPRRRSVHVQRRSQSERTVWKKNAVCRLLTASVWSTGRVSIGQDGERKKKKKKNTFLTTHGKAELWRATHTCCSEGACFTYSPSDQRAGFSLAPRVYILWLGVSQRAEKERGEHDIDVTASRGWMNHSSNNGAPVTEVLSVCHRWES